MTRYNTMMDCREMRALIQRWEEGASPDREELELAEAHGAQCPDCHRRFGALLPLLQRDARILTEVPGPGINIADEVMDRIRAEKAGVSRSLGPRKAVLVPVMAAAAALIIGIGLLVGVPHEEEFVTVRFVLDDPAARTVSVAGDFTGWETNRVMMRQVKQDGPWEVTIRLRRGGLHTYNFVIDGNRWVTDPASRIQVDDGFGGRASLLDI